MSPVEPETESSAGTVIRPVVVRVVAIGSSAGGLEALQDLVAPLVAGGGTAYVVAQHLSPEHRSLIVELLSHSTSLRVETAIDGGTLEADVIVIGPPNADLTVEGARVRVSDPAVRFGPSPGIDLMFDSVATSWGEHSIGIVLSGTGSDGAHGLRGIRGAGGLTMVQNPESARFDGMPRAAIALGGADVVASAAELGQRLALVSHEGDTWTGGHLPVPAPDRLTSISDQLQRVTGIDFSRYKESTLTRQIRRRMAVLQVRSVEDYLPMLAADPDEARALARNLLVTVTAFFRDPDAFAALRVQLVTYLEGREDTARLRIWVPGCATGEEVYSLAMLVSDVLGDPVDLDRRLKVFGTDLDEASLLVARRGEYPRSAVDRLPESMRERFVDEMGDDFRINERIRDCVVFARHNVAEDPPFPRIDLVSCRNTLIYFTSPMQDRVLAFLGYALNPGGLLFLGSSESLGGRSVGFESADDESRIYRRLAEMPAIVGRPAPIVTPSRSPGHSPISGRVTVLRDSVPEQHVALLEALVRSAGHAFIVLDENHDLVEVVGDVAPFVRIPQGPVTSAATSFLEPALQGEARALFLMSHTAPEPVRGRLIDLGEGRGTVRLEAHALPVGDRRLTVLAFLRESSPDSRGSSMPAIGEPFDQALEQLERELIASQDSLRRSLAELEAANEELEASSEELQASSEELQSSNEELEASNEELRATNEQLGALNQTTRQRSDELQMLNTELANVQASSIQGLVIVDRNLCVTRFSPLAVRVFGLVTADIGSPLVEVPTTMPIPGLEAALRSVADGEARHSIEATAENDICYLIQVLPYVANDGQRLGAIVTLTDITETVSLRAEAQSAMTELTRVTDALDEAVWKRDASRSRLLYVSGRIEQLIGWTPEELVANPGLLDAAIDPEDREGTALARAAGATGWSIEYRVSTRSGEPRWMLETAALVTDSPETFYVGTIADITAQHVIAELASNASATFEAVFNTRAFGVLVLDDRNRVVMANDSFCQLMGYTPEAIVGMPAVMFRTSEDRGAGQEDDVEDSSQLVIRKLLRGDGTFVWVEIETKRLATRIGQAQSIIIVNDITELREKTEQLTEQAATDSLTGLINRRYFTSALVRSLETHERSGDALALVWVDIDRFKEINDEFGHDAGDAFLKVTGERIDAVLRPSEIVGRLGGDEYGVIISGFERPADLESALERIVGAVRVPMLIGGAEVSSTASLGVALYPSDRSDADELIRAADTAMYTVKGRGGDGFAYFSESMNEAADDRRHLRASIARAIQNEEFELHYQPIISASDGSLRKVEALLRWRHDGRVDPASSFVPFCEDNGQIRALSQLLFAILRDDVRAIRTTLPPDVLVAVNMAVAQLEDPALIELLSKWPAPTGLAGLVVEVVESVFLPGNHRAMATVRLLESLGALISVDDYGIGYSNLTLMSHLSPGFLKIDKSLLPNHQHDDPKRTARLFVSAVTLGHAIGATVVAEGIEDDVTREFAVNLGADLLQGFAIAPAMPAVELAAWLAARQGD